MEIYLIILMWFLIPIKLSIAENHNTKLEERLRMLSKDLHEQLVKKIRAIRETDTDFEEASFLGSYKHVYEVPDSNVIIFTFFNKTFFVIDQNISIGTLTKKAFKMDFYGNFIHEKTIFFKAFQYQQTGFLVLSTENDILIYTFTENGTHPDLIQTVSTPYSSDGTFFVNADTLYFVSTSNRGEHIGLIKFYKWLGSHFDEIETLHTIGAVKVCSFPHKLSEIIIVEQSLPEDTKVHSSVYEFKQEKVRKIQQLNTDKPINMDIYYQDAVPHVLVYEKFKNHKLYKWNGFEMVFVNRFQWEHSVDKSIVVYSNTIPLIVQPQLDKVLVFKPQNEDIKLYKTESYLANYSVILDINKGENENGNITFIVGLNEDNIINIYGMSFKAHAEMETEQEGTLRNCFHNLETRLYDRRKKLNQISNSLVEVSVVDRSLSNSRKRHASLNSTADGVNLENKLAEIKSRVNNVRPFIMNHGNTPNQLVVNSKAIIKDNIAAEKVIAGKVEFKKINDGNWTPEQWLRYNKKQVITGPVKITKIDTKVLVAQGDAAVLFKNLVRVNGNQTLAGNFKINNLRASKIFSERINGIEIDTVYKQGDSSIVKGTKSFHNVSAKKADVRKINDNNTETIISGLQNTNRKSDVTFASQVNIDRIDVESIDNINWADFANSVFKIGEDHIILGNLTIPEMQTVKLQTNKINGINSDHLMTESSDQVINSTIEFNNIKASSIKCRTVNDVDITKAVQIGQNGTVVRGHVQIEEVNVLHDLELTGKLGRSFFVKEGDHIFGTDESDLIQRYLGKVVVKGNLYVNDFSILSNATIFLRGNNYTLDVINEYWNKDGYQIIPVHFKATKGVSTPHLKTISLNGIPMDRFALNNKKSQIASPLSFENVTVNGNIVLEKDKTGNSFDLEKLANEGVKTDGGKYVLKGNKVFLNKLVIKHLDAQKTPEQHSTGTKIIKNLIVKGDLISNISADTLNDINIRRFTENVLALNKPQNLKDIVMKNLTVENLQVKMINGKQVAEYLDKLQGILRDNQIRRVNIKGNVTIEKVYSLSTINGHRADEISKEDTAQNITKADWIGDVKFTKKVNIRNLKARDINGINFPSLTKRLLYKKSNQTITGIYTFTNLNTVDLYAEHINDKNIGNLTDISSSQPQQIKAPKGIIFRKNRLEKPVHAETMIPCDINKAMSNIRYPETQEWAVVEISGNVTFLDENSDLIRVLEKSVKKDQENIITASVLIKGHALAERVTVRDSLNGINLTELVADAVLKDAEEEQIITGHKIFTNVINADIVTVMENADIPIVNRIFIPELYRKIIRKDLINNITILGTKTFFGGLQTNRFLTDKIAEIKPENIVSLTNLNHISSVLFDSIDILNNLNVRFINSYDLDFILNNRLFTNITQKQITNGVYFFDDLEFLDNIRTTAINNIDIKNVVFDTDKQKIVASKWFLQNITVFGNVSVAYLNGINVTDAQNNALLHGRTEVINGSVTILSPVKIKGNVTAETINGYRTDQMKEAVNHTVNKVEEEVILSVKEKVKSIIQDSLSAVKYLPNEFMYIERSKDLQVQIQNAVDATVTTIKGYPLIHILSEEPHQNCNLPEGCKCPVQYTVEVTPQLSVNYFLNKHRQRIYSYDDDTLTIHLITSSISTDTQCRTNETEHLNEVSTMTWSTTTTGNITGTFNIHPIFFRGYISGVEFFSLNGKTYAIIARYYDPEADTHDLDCTVIRFSEEKTSASEIQKIPTQGAWTLYLLYTAQGVTIVIGNLAKQPYTQIYRFNENSEKFELLRTVAYRCTRAVGVVLGTDSLIILANEEAPLQVLKYHPDYDNYYYYQMFALDEPVLGMSVFYVGGFGISEAYLSIVTEEHYRIYSFQYIDGWKLESRGAIKGLRNLIPFELNDQLYLFAPTTGESLLLTVVKHGSKET